MCSTVARRLEVKFAVKNAMLFVMQVPHLAAFPGPRSIVIADGCAIHHDAEFRAAIEQTGARLLFLPPYSPDYNPVSGSALKMQR